MRPLTFGPFASPLVYSPADLARGSQPEDAVMEIVSFRLRPGTDSAAFLEAARATKDMLARQTGFLRRRLVQDPSGLWTDLIEWRSLTQAHRAAETLMQSPVFAAFMAAIDASSVEMRHLPVIWQMD